MIKPILKDIFLFYFYHGMCSNNYFEYDTFYNPFILGFCRNLLALAFIYANRKKGFKYIKMKYLQIKHPQSIFPRFLTWLNSKTELLDLIWKHFLGILGNEIIPAKSM